MKKYITEFIGTFFLVMAAARAGGVGAGLTLWIMVFAGAHVSGAHYNPAVSLAIWLRGRSTAAEMLAYWSFQIAGGIVAALVVWRIFEVEGAGTCAVPDDGIIKGVLAEVLGTFALAYVVLNVATSKATAGNFFYGAAIGGAVLAMATVLGKFSGGGFNPAVAIGLSIQKSFCWEQIWIYVLGAFVGAAIAAFVFKYLNPDDK